MAKTSVFWLLIGSLPKNNNLGDRNLCFRDVFIYKRLAKILAFNNPCFYFFDNPESEVNLFFRIRIYLLQDLIKLSFPTCVKLSGCRARKP